MANTVIRNKKQSLNSIKLGKDVQIFSFVNAYDWTCVDTYVEEGAAIGSGATILCGIRIGKDAVIGAGSVVTKDVPDRAIVAGNPARIIRYITDQNHH